MSDVIDTSNKMEDIYLNAAINNARKVKVKYVPKGKCINCAEPFTNKVQLFCDTDCEHDHSVLVKNGKI